MQVPAMQLRRFGLILTTLVLATTLSVVFLSLAAPEAIPVRAAASGPQEWLIIAHYSGTVSIIDPATDIVYGPVLTGELGSEAGGIHDVAVSPKGGIALISNFGDNAVYFVSLANLPISPSVIASVTTPMAAGDIAISPDGRFALVSGGSPSPYIAVIDLRSRTLAYTVEMGTAQAQAVDIAPNGTVVVADYVGGAEGRSFVHALYPDASGQLTVTGSYSYALAMDGELIDPSSTMTLPTPSNVVIAPDGQTVFVCDATPYNNDPETGHVADPRYAVGIYQIVAPGVLSFTSVIANLTRATQSIAFSPDGTQAYLSRHGTGYTYTFTDPGERYNDLAILDITGPEQVSLDREKTPELPRMTLSGFLGVDSLVVSNDKAYVAYATNSNASNDLRVVKLSDYSYKRLEMPGIPVSVDVIPVQKIYLPFVISDQP